MSNEIYMNVENLIDLNKYPIHQPDSAEYLEIVKSVKSDLAEDGCAVLSSFLSVEGLDTIANEAEERKSKAYYADSKLYNVYLSNNNPDEAEDHPQNILMERTKSRPLPTKQITTQKAFWISVLLTLAGLFMLYMINYKTAFFAAVSVFLYTCIYISLSLYLQKEIITKKTQLRNTGKRALTEAPSQQF